MTTGGRDVAWVVTCDPGVDDAVALAVAAGHPGCEVRAIVAGAGNIDAPTAWRNAVGLVALFGLDVTVAMGGGDALDGRSIVRAGALHGDDGLAGLRHRLPLPGHPAGSGPGRDLAVPARDGGALVVGHVLALGPLTEVARALRAGRAVDHVVWMGGSTTTAPGTAGAAEEFNAVADPAAVDEVLGSPVAAEVVPLDVTRQVSLSATDLDRWRTGPPAARLCAELAASRTGPAAPRRRPAEAVLHDPVALVAALEPGLFAWSERRVRCTRVDEQPPGALVPAPQGRGGIARVAVDVDVPAVRERILDAVVTLGS